MDYQVNDNRGWYFTKVENTFLDDDVHFDIYEKMVYICLCRFANAKSKSAFPSAKRIGSMAGCSERKVRDCINSLHDKRIITKEDRQGKTPIIHLNGLTPAQDSGVSGTPFRGTPAHGADELEKENKKKITRKTDADASSDLFNSWWDLYGKKVKKPDAEKAFNKMLKKYSYEVIVEGTKRFLASEKKKGTDKKYIPHPSTFLNGERFNDEYDDAPKQDKPSAPVDVKSIEIVQRMNDITYALEREDDPSIARQLQQEYRELAAEMNG